MPRWKTPTRLLLSLALFSLIWAVGQVQYWEGFAARWILWLGQQLGYDYFNLSGRILMTPDGPFSGGPSWMNYAYNVVPELSVAVACFTASALVYWLLGLHRARLAGNTRCGRCDHILRGLTEPRCPECGQAI